MSAQTDGHFCLIALECLPMIVVFKQNANDNLFIIYGARNYTVHRPVG